MKEHISNVSRHKLSLCDLSNIVTFEHNELWCPPTTNKLSVTFYPSNSTQKYCPNLLFFDEIKKNSSNQYFLDFWYSKNQAHQEECRKNIKFKIRVKLRP